MLPPTIPIFPLPNVVLFPNVFLPLHIFEPRYRAMVADALKGDRMIGMTLLRPGFEPDYDGRPAVYETGCAGLITHSEPLADGRYDIVLRGLEKFRIVEEDTSRPYRIARVEALPEMTGDDERAEIRARRQRLEAVLAATIERSSGEPRFPPAVPDDDLVNALAQYLPLEPVERQALLERRGIAERCRGLIELLEMHTLTGRNLSWKDRSVH
jgi:Lon protease-like protein